MNKRTLTKGPFSGTFDGFQISGSQWEGPEGNRYWDIVVPYNGKDQDFLRVTGTDIRKIQENFETGRNPEAEVRIGGVAQLKPNARDAIAVAIKTWEANGVA